VKTDREVCLQRIELLQFVSNGSDVLNDRSYDGTIANVGQVRET
jgi:hypothetical protein